MRKPLLKLILFSLSCGHLLAQDAKAPSNLILNLPNNIDYPEESMRLTIQLPNKIQPSKEAKELENRKTIGKKFDFDSNPFKRISSKSRYREIMQGMISKGLIPSSYDRRIINSASNPLIEPAARIVIRVYQALLQLEKNSRLRAHNIRPEDLEDMKELIDELQRQIKMFTFQPSEMQKDMDRIKEVVSKASGRGSINITGVKESDDGTTIELEISREL